MISDARLKASVTCRMVAAPRRPLVLQSPRSSAAFSRPLFRHRPCLWKMRRPIRNS